MCNINSGTYLETLVTFPTMALFNLWPNSLMDHIDQSNVLRTYECACPTADTQPPFRNVLYVEQLHHLHTQVSMTLQQGTYFVEQVKDSFLHLGHCFFQMFS